MTVRDDLIAATERYQALKPRWEEAQKTVVSAVIAALKAGISPNDVTALSPFTSAYVRKVARGAGIPPALPGPKPRRADGVIYAVRRAGEDTWYGEPDALPHGEYQDATVTPHTGRGNRFDEFEVEVRYGPVADDATPSFYAYMTVDGKRMRPTAVVHEVLFGADR